jgi:hypothetical protein
MHKPFCRDYFHTFMCSCRYNSPDCNHKLIDVKLYNVLEIHCSCPQWFLDFFIEGRMEGLGGGFIRCEICINHFVEIIFTLSCAVVDINLLQINCSQNFLLKMCKKNCTDIHWWFVYKYPKMLPFTFQIKISKNTRWYIIH